jgi:hypothetical protein
LRDPDNLTRRSDEQEASAFPGGMDVYLAWVASRPACAAGGGYRQSVRLRGLASNAGHQRGKAQGQTGEHVLTPSDLPKTKKVAKNGGLFLFTGPPADYSLCRDSHVML